MNNKLSKRIIPCLDIDKGRVVKGKSFINLVDAGDPSELSKHYNNEGADELVFLDITASHEQRKAIIDVVEKVSSEVFIPLTVGGGIRNLDNISELLLAGADKVSINTSAIEDPEFIKKSSSKFGSQCIVVAIDAKKTDESWNVYTYGGRKDTGINVIEWAKKARGAEIGKLLRQVKAIPDKDVPIFVVGDFNEPSHLDWTEAAAKAGRHPIKVAYPTSTEMAKAGFSDSYRKIYPDEMKNPGITW